MANVLRLQFSEQQSATIDYETLAELPSEAHVQDVSALDPRRQGTGVRFDAVLESLGLMNEDPSQGDRMLELCSSTDDFSYRLRWDVALEQGMVIYALNGQPLTSEQGGPFRFMVPGTAQCGTAEVDNCANVKHVDLIRLV